MEMSWQLTTWRSLASCYPILTWVECAALMHRTMALVQSKGIILGSFTGLHYISLFGRKSVSLILDSESGAYTYFLKSASTAFPHQQSSSWSCRLLPPYQTISPTFSLPTPCVLWWSSWSIRHDTVWYQCDYRYHLQCVSVKNPSMIN